MIDGSCSSCARITIELAKSKKAYLTMEIQILFFGFLCGRQIHNNRTKNGKYLSTWLCIFILWFAVNLG